jgi:hypothetical protein
MGIAMAAPCGNQGFVKRAKNDGSSKWAFTTSGHWHKGQCPPPRKGKGTMSFTKKGSTATLTVLSGMMCKPKAICTCRGKVKGKHFRCSKTVKVDDEGGKAHNSFHLIRKSSTKMKGTVRSWYKHPSGFKCSWGFKVSLTKR